jgi:hypothetical protein
VAHVLNLSLDYLINLPTVSNLYINWYRFWNLSSELACMSDSGSPEAPLLSTLVSGTRTEIVLRRLGPDLLE